MEKVYRSYRKVIDGSTYFFVKQFLVFPEIPNVQPVLEKYGMHTDFDKACNIAGLKDEIIKMKLLQEIENEESLVKVIEIDDINYKDIKAAVV
jgi:hypothetical protein